MCLPHLELIVVWTRPWEQLMVPLYPSSFGYSPCNHCRPALSLGSVGQAAHPAVHLGHPHSWEAAQHNPAYFCSQKTNLWPTQLQQKQKPSRAWTPEIKREWEGGQLPEKEWTPGQPEAVYLSTTTAPVSVSYSRAGLGEHGTFLSCICTRYCAGHGNCSDLCVAQYYAAKYARSNSVAYTFIAFRQ